MSPSQNSRQLAQELDSTLRLFIPVKVGPLSLASFPRDVIVHIPKTHIQAELSRRGLAVNAPRCGQGMMALTETGDTIVQEMRKKLTL